MECFKVFFLVFLLHLEINSSNTIKVRHKHDDRRYGRQPGEVPISAEKRLTKYLVERYRTVGTGGRPVVNFTDPVIVKYGLAMIQMELDERQSMLRASVWCRVRWYDQYLTWDPTKFEGVSTIRLSSRKIWIPDVMLYNTADTHILERDVLVVVSSNGSVLWIPHRVYQSTCSVDITNYPFDVQTCDMTFGSWAYHGNEINLVFYDDLERMDISDLERESTKWDILGQAENRRIQYYDCCEDPYVTLTFTLKLKRKLVFSSFILTLPCIFLACMTLVVFWLPPERPDRTSLAMSLFSSFLLLLLILVEAAPPTASSVPTLGLYYCFNMVIIMLSIFLSSVVININRRGDSMTPVPGWLRTVCYSCLGRLFCTTWKRNIARKIARRNRIKKDSPDSNKIIANSEAMSPNEVRVPNYCVHTGVEPEEWRRSFRDTSQSHSTSVDKHLYRGLQIQLHSMEKVLKSMDTSLQGVFTSLRDKDITRDMRELRVEWQFVAMTLDRLFFVIFVLAIVLSLVTLFPRPYELRSE